ncbi:hypothetical protein [Achromobacter phage Motura]|uniref:Uncharacterized protein n=1 Tax=Achromobacter phage Motura TaxID=2591403 RepID=A0A514CSJ5_9CAUD|nr:hypothetical protein H1O15_gp039 [Achromobacter phage Motura]QDH83447.1 hypothetical protein [Achromobacter phage Motura]
MKPRFKSAFFFRLGDKHDAERKRRAELKPAVIQVANEAVVVRSESYKDELGPRVDNEASSVREFLLTEFAIKSTAADTGMLQAVEVLKNVSGSEVEESIQRRFEQLRHKAMTIRLARYLADHFGLEESDVDLLLDAVTPPKPANIIFPSLSEVTPDSPVGAANEKSRSATKSVSRPGAKRLRTPAK